MFCYNFILSMYVQADSSSEPGHSQLSTPTTATGPKVTQGHPPGLSSSGSILLTTAQHQRQQIFYNFSVNQKGVDSTSAKKRIILLYKTLMITTFIAHAHSSKLV
jgi:hypothetical protein